MRPSSRGSGRSGGRNLSAAPGKPCWRQASYDTTAAEFARLSERRPGTIGIRSRSVTRSWPSTSSDRPVGSGPNSSTSPGSNATSVCQRVACAVNANTRMPAERAERRVEVRVDHHRREVVVVQPGPLQLRLGQVEAQRLDEVQGRAGRRHHPDRVARVGRDPRLEEHHVEHGVNVAPMPDPPREWSTLVTSQARQRLATRTWCSCSTAPFQGDGRGSNPRVRSTSSQARSQARVRTIRSTSSERSVSALITTGAASAAATSRARAIHPRRSRTPGTGSP